jgi:hypothetical protein
VLEFQAMENQEYFVVTALKLEDLMDTVEVRFKEGWRGTTLEDVPYRFLLISFQNTLSFLKGWFYFFKPF